MNAEDSLHIIFRYFVHRLVAHANKNNSHFLLVLQMGLCGDLLWCFIYESLVLINGYFTKRGRSNKLYIVSCLCRHTVQ